MIPNDQEFDAAIKALDGDSVKSDAEARTISVAAKEGVSKLTATLAILEKANVKVETVSLRKPTLDDVFMELTGHEAEEIQDEPEAKGKKSKGKK